MAAAEMGGKQPLAECAAVAVVQMAVATAAEGKTEEEMVEAGVTVVEPEKMEGKEESSQPGNTWR